MLFRSAELENWRGFDAMYDVRMKAFSLYNVMPQEVEKNVAQTMSLYASAFRDTANGKYTLKQTENYGKWLSIQQTFAHAATVQGQAALMQGRAAITNANAKSVPSRENGGFLRSRFRELTWNLFMRNLAPPPPRLMSTGHLYVYTSTRMCRCIHNHWAFM